MSHQVLLSTLSNETENHDDFRIFLFGSPESIPQQLIKLTDNLNIYYDFNQCDEDMKSIKSDCNILFVFTDYFDYMLYLGTCTKIHSIYVLNRNHQSIEYTKNDCPKLAYIFDTEDVLIRRLRQDLLLTYRDDFSIRISSLKDLNNQLSLTHFDTNEELFYWNQLFHYTLVHESNIDMPDLKQQMIEQLKVELQDENGKDKLIQEFEQDCASKSILRWYTRASCIFQLVNKAFRTRNIDLICKFRYFIILLYRELKQLSNEKPINQSLTLYRAQEMRKNELEILKKSRGCFISTNTFISTTKAKDVAEMFLVPQKSVLFEIQISNPSQDFVFPFADITHESLIHDEEEILFFSGAIFRIEQINETSIKLNLTNEKTEYFEQFMNILQTKLAFIVRYGEIAEKTNDFSLFNRYHKCLSKGKYSAIDIAKLFMCIDEKYLFINCDKPNKLIEYYEQLLQNQNFIDDKKRIVLNILIGKNHFHLKQYEIALSKYNLALSLLDGQHRLTGDIYDHIGDVWLETSDYQSALLCFQQALQIVTSYDPNDKQIPHICRKLADIHWLCENYQDARPFESRVEQVNNYYKKLHSSDASMIARYNEQANANVDIHMLEYFSKLYVGGMYEIRRGLFKEGLDNLLTAEEFIKNNVCLYGDYFHKLAKLYEHAAYAYLCMNERLKALIIWKKAIDIRANFHIQ